MHTILRATLTALISAIEGAATALVGLVVVAVPLLLVWWIDFDLSAEPGQMVSAAAGSWLLAHLVPLTFSLSPEAALGFGLEPAALSFTISLAPLGITLITVLLSARVGWRLAARGGLGASGLLGGTVGFGLAAWVATLLAAPFHAWPLWRSILVPALCYGVSAVFCYVLHAALRGDAWWLDSVRFLQRVARKLDPFPSAELRASALPARAVETLRLAAGAVAGLAALSALAVAVAVVVGYVDIVALSQTLQLEVLGLVVLFLLNLSMLPVVCIWGIAWLTGAGFSIGAGSSVTPFETLLGPLPAFPLLGAVPQGWGWAGGLAPALVVLTAVAIGALAGGRTELRFGSLTTSIVVPLVAAALAGLVVAGLAALATGAIGPERLMLTGPKPWVVGGLAALEIGIGLVPGVLARRLDIDRWRSTATNGTADETTDGDATMPLAGIDFESDAVRSDEPPADEADETSEQITEPLPNLMADEADETSEQLTEPLPDLMADEEEPPGDALLRAFAWDDPESTSDGIESPKPATPKKRGWRLPRRGG